MEKVIIVISSVFIILIFVALGSMVHNDIDYGTREGVVMDKSYHSAYTTYVNSYAGKTSIMIPQFHPESWSIKIQKQENGKTKERWIDVTEERYNQIKVGDYWEE